MALSLLHNEITDQIIGAAIEVHRIIGPGLLESVYEGCMHRELGLRGVAAVSQVRVPLVYKDVEVGGEYRVDLVVEDKVIVELKAIEGIAPVHEAQLLTYMRLLHKQVGLLINFNVPVLKDGIVTSGHLEPVNLVQCFSLRVSAFQTNQRCTQDESKSSRPTSSSSGAGFRAVRVADR